MNYSLYVELFSNLEYKRNNGKLGKEFCEKLQNSLKLGPGNHDKEEKIEEGKGRFFKTIKTEEGDKKLKFEYCLIKGDRLRDKTRQIIVSSDEIIIDYVENIEKKIHSINIYNMFIEFEHGIYIVKNNKLAYYDREAVEFTKNLAKKDDFKQNDAESNGIIPDKEVLIKPEDVIDFFTKIVTLKKEKIDKYLGECLSSQTMKHSK